MKSSKSKNHKLLVFNPSFNTIRIIERLTSQSVTDGDKVLIALPFQSRSEQVDIILTLIELFLKQMISWGVWVRLKKVPVNELSIEGTLVTVYHTVSSKGEQIFVELFEDPRILVIATYLVALLKLAYDKLFDVKIIITRLEFTGSKLEVPLMSLSIKLDFELLSSLSENPLRINQLSTMLGKEKLSIIEKIERYEQIKIVQRSKSFWTLTETRKILYGIEDLKGKGGSVS
jgi:hypothetical protein